jgi:hypothetical protein
LQVARTHAVGGIGQSLARRQATQDPWPSHTVPPVVHAVPAGAWFVAQHPEAQAATAHALVGAAQSEAMAHDPPPSHAAPDDELALPPVGMPPVLPLLALELVPPPLLLDPPLPEALTLLMVPPDFGPPEDPQLTGPSAIARAKAAHASRLPGRSPFRWVLVLFDIDDLLTGRHRHGTQTGPTIVGERGTWGKRRRGREDGNATERIQRHASRPRDGNHRLRVRRLRSDLLLARALPGVHRRGAPRS